jgi:hypothetical protein
MGLRKNRPKLIHNYFFRGESSQKYEPFAQLKTLPRRGRRLPPTSEVEELQFVIVIEM